MNTMSMGGFRGSCTSYTRDDVRDLYMLQQQQGMVMGIELLFEKKLYKSDTDKLCRLAIPKMVAKERLLKYCKLYLENPWGRLKSQLQVGNFSCCFQMHAERNL